jgi:hypothetical protein
MDSIGDFLYLILMVGAVIVSVIKKSRDKQKPVPPPTHNAPIDPSDFFPEIRNWLDDEEQAPKPVFVPVVEKKTQVKSVPGNSVFTYDSPENLQPGPAIVKSHYSDKTDGSHLPKFNVFDDEQFDLRKAVLYSEIMKRPSW